MNQMFNDNAAWMDASVRHFHTLDPKAQRDAYKAILRTFATGRPQFGLVANPTPLTTLFVPGGESTNLKIGKNDAATLSLTTSSHASCRVVANGETFVLNTCKWAGLCVGLCVLSHGRGSFSTVKAARSWRTWALWAHPELFAVALAFEVKAALNANERVLARFNVNSDLPWHLVESLFDDQRLNAYDYTKDATVLDGDGWTLPNYRRIYSFNESSNTADVAEFLLRGGTTAMVTNRPKGAATRTDLMVDGWFVFPIVDGDLSDNRFDDPAGVVVDLYAKGKARNRKSAFVQSIYS